MRRGKKSKTVQLFSTPVMYIFIIQSRQRLTVLGGKRFFTELTLECLLSRSVDHDLVASIVCDASKVLIALITTVQYLGGEHELNLRIQFQSHRYKR